VGKFFGTYNRSLDDKNRLQVPSKMVKELPSRFFLLRGLDGCLSVYEESTFDKMLSKLESLSFFDEKCRSYIRLSASSASELPVDSHGRIMLGRDIIEQYKIGVDVVIIGVIDHFEIWDAAAYAKYISSKAPEYEELAASIG
jgi:MraZ protein